MALLWHRSLLIALIGLLVKSPGTMADHTADPKGIASNGTSFIKQNGIASNGTSFVKQNQSNQLQLARPSLPDAAGTSKKPSPASGHLSSENTGLDYDLTDIFGDNSAFDFPSESSFSTFLVSPVVETKETSGTSDKGSISTGEKSETLPGLAPLMEFEKHHKDSISIDQELETRDIVQNLPNGERFRTPPPLTDDFPPETRYGESLHQSESKETVKPGGSIPKVVNKPGSPADYSYTYIPDPVEPSIVNNELVNYPRNVQTELISGALLSTANGAPQVGGPRLYYGAPLQASAPPRPNYGAPPQAGAPPKFDYGAPPQAGAPPILNYGAPQAGAPPILNYGAPQAVALPIHNYGAPQAGASLSPTYGAPQAGAFPILDYGAPPQAGASVSPTYGTPQPASPSPPATVSSYGELPANSFTFEEPSEEVGEEPYSGFFATLLRTGSARDAISGYASDLWKRFTKSVGTKVAKKSKIIIAKAAPFVKKVVGATAIADFFQGAGADASNIIDVSAPVATVVGESLVHTDFSGTPNTVQEHVAPEAPLPSYNALPQNPQTSYGAPPVLPVAYYGAPIAPIVNKAKDVVQPQSVFIPEFQIPTGGQDAKYTLEETVKYLLPASPTKYDFPEPVKYNVQASEQHDVVLGHANSVMGTGPAAPILHHLYPAAPQTEFPPTVQYGLPPVQPLAAPAPVLYWQAHQVQYYPYLPPRASHYIRNQDDEQQVKESDTTRPRKGLFAIFDKVQEGYNTVYNTFEYGRNLTNQATEGLGGFWPGNWFRSTVSQPGESPAAPAAASIVSSYAAPVVIPVAAATSSDGYAEGTHVNHHPVNYIDHQYPGYVGRLGFEEPQRPFAPSYITALSGPIGQENQEEPTRF